MEIKIDQIEITKRNLDNDDSINDQSLGEFTTPKTVEFLEALPKSDIWLYYITIWDEDEFIENISAEEWLEDYRINQKLVERGIL